MRAGATRIHRTNLVRDDNLSALRFDDDDIDRHKFVY